MSDSGETSNSKVEAEGREEEATTDSANANTSSVFDLMEEFLSEIKDDLALEEKEADGKSLVKVSEIETIDTQIDEKEENKNDSCEKNTVSPTKHQELKTKSSSLTDDINEECPFKKPKLDLEETNLNELVQVIETEEINSEKIEKEEEEIIKNVDPVNSDSLESSVISEDQVESKYENDASASASASDFIDLESLRRSEIDKIIELASIDDVASQLTPDNLGTVMDFSNDETKNIVTNPENDNKMLEANDGSCETNNISKSVLEEDNEDVEQVKQIDPLIEVYEATQENAIQFLSEINKESSDTKLEKSNVLTSSSVIEDIKEDLDASVIIVEPNKADDVVEQQASSASSLLSLIDDLKEPNDKPEEELFQKNISELIQVNESTIIFDAEQSIAVETEATASLDNDKKESSNQENYVDESMIIFDADQAEMEAIASQDKDKEKFPNAEDAIDESTISLDSNIIETTASFGNDKKECPTKDTSIDESTITFDTAQAEIIEAIAGLNKDNAEFQIDESTTTIPLDSDIIKATASLDNVKEESPNQFNSIDESILILDAVQTDIIEGLPSLDKDKAESIIPEDSIVTLEDLEDSKGDSLNENSLHKSNESINDLENADKDFLDSSATTGDEIFFSLNNSTASDQVEVLEQTNKEEEIVLGVNEEPKSNEKPAIFSSDTCGELNFQVCYNFKYSESGQIVNDSENLAPLITFSPQKIKVEEKNLEVASLGPEDIEANIEEETLDASVSSNCAISVIDLDEEIGDNDDDDGNASTKVSLENSKENLDSIKIEVDELNSDFERLNEAEDDVTSEFGITDEIDLEAALMTAAADAEAAIEAYQKGEVEQAAAENNIESMDADSSVAALEDNESTTCSPEAGLFEVSQNSAVVDIRNTAQKTIPADESPETEEINADIESKDLIRYPETAQSPEFKTEHLEENIQQMEQEEDTKDLNHKVGDVVVKKEEISRSSSPIPPPTPDPGILNTSDIKDFDSIGSPLQIKNEVKHPGYVATPKMKERLVASLLHSSSDDSIERPRLMSGVIDPYEENRLAKIKLLESDDDDDDEIMDTQLAAAQRTPYANTTSNSFDEMSMDVEIPETPSTTYHNDSHEEIQENQENASVINIKKEESGSSDKRSEAEKEKSVKKPLSAQNLAKFNQATRVTKRRSLSQSIQPETTQIMTRSRSRSSLENDGMSMSETNANEPTAKPLSVQNLAKFNEDNRGATKRRSLSQISKCVVPELNRIMTRSRSRSSLENDAMSTSASNVSQTNTKSNQRPLKRKPNKLSLKASRNSEGDENPSLVLPNQLLAVISNLYLDSIERLKLDFPTRCARDLSFCKKKHFHASEPNTPSNSQQQLMRCALQQQRYLIYVSIVEDMCHRNEFPGESVLVELIELILSINSKTYNNEALQHLYIKCIETFRLIVRTFPPCWLALRPAYRNFFESYLDKSKLYKNADIEDNPNKILKTLLSILDETLEACAEEDLATNRFDTDPSQLSQPENLDQSEVFNQWEWEQQQNRFQTFEALTPANRLERIMVVLNLLLFILENDFSIWMLQHYTNPVAKIFETKTSPLMVTLFELTQYTRLTDNVSKIFCLFAKAARKNLNTSRLEILERYISLIMIASNTADLVITRNGIKYPEVGAETKNLINQFFKIFKSNNLSNVNTYPKTIEMFRQPFLRYEFINKFLEIFYYQRSEDFTPEKIKNEILKHKRFLKYRPERDLPDGSTDELSQQQYLNLLTIALKSYCEWHGCRTFLHLHNTGSEMPRVTTSTSTKYYQANGGNGKILLHKMEEDIDILNQMLRLYVKIGLPKVDLPKADLIVDESTIVKYQRDLTQIKLLQKYVPGLTKVYPGVDFEPLAEYLNTFVVYFNDE